MDGQKVEGFCGMVEFLHRAHSQWVRNTQANKKQQKLNRVVGISYKVIEDFRLAEQLKAARAGEPIDFLASDRFLFLRPSEADGALLPVVSLKANFGKPELRIRLALFTFDASEEPAAIGFRFETPEGPGRHDYHHGQMIRSFDKAMRDLPKVPVWLPTRQPTLMMSARTPFALFLGLLISLYGLKHLEREWQGQRFLQSFKDDLEQLKHGCGVSHT